MLSKFIEALATTIDIQSFVGRILMAAVLGFASAGILSFRASSKQHHRILKSFAAISMTMAMMVSILASSHALAIGMVGAISLVRFRWVTHDPLSVVLLFIAMAMGMAAGFGVWPAGLLMLVAVGIALIWFPAFKNREISFLSVGGDPQNTAIVIQEAMKLYPQLRVAQLESSQSFAAWDCQIAGLDAGERLKLSNYLQTKLPHAQIRLRHEE